MVSEIFLPPHGHLRVEHILHVQTQSERNNIDGKILSDADKTEKYRHNATGRHGKPADNPMRLTDRQCPTFCKPKNRRRRCVICCKNDKR